MRNHHLSRRTFFNRMADGVHGAALLSLFGADLTQLSQLSAFETGRPLVFNKGTPKVSTTFSMGEERRVRSDSGP